MTVDVSTDVIIDRPVGVVALYAADPKNAPEWYANIDSVQWKSEPSLSVGARVAFVARFLGRRLEYTYEFVDYVPGERLVMRTTEGPFPMETTYVWIPATENSTHMELRNRGEPAGFSKVAAPFMGSAMGLANRKDLTSLKKILESR